jgi:hypothetical protein
MEPYEARANIESSSDRVSDVAREKTATFFDVFIFGMVSFSLVTNKSTSFRNLFIYYLGTMLAFNGVLIFWNVGLESGFREFCICTLIVSLAFIALNLCLAEITSIIPFSGVYIYLTFVLLP